MFHISKRMALTHVQVYNEKSKEYREEFHMVLLLHACLHLLCCNIYSCYQCYNFACPHPLHCCIYTALDSLALSSYTSLCFIYLYKWHSPLVSYHFRLHTPFFSYACFATLPLCQSSESLMATTYIQV